MSKDGRLTVRFGDLMTQIEAAAKADERSAAVWVRRQIKIALRREQKEKQRTAAVA